MSYLPTTPSGIGVMETAIRKAVNDRISELTAQEVAEAQKRIAQKVPEIIAGITLSLMKSMSMERFGEELRVTLKIQEAPQ